jgi:site-specific recombinase XerD
MRAEGYVQQTVEFHINLVADFSQWLSKRRIKVNAITTDHFQPYLKVRMRHRRPTRSDMAVLKRLWNLLLRQGALPEPVLPVTTPAEQIRSEFHLYLQQQRGLATTTQSNYLSFAGEFLAARFGTGPVDLSCLCAADVTGFVQRRAATFHSQRVQSMTTALRSFLRFMRWRGDINSDLAACVPSVANWRRSTIPRAIPPKQVELVLASVNRDTATGRRDYAILLLLARLGLRAHEVSTLTLEDMNWQDGWITVRGKTGRYSQLPLPVDIGEAIADYLRNGRPRSSSRCVFLLAKAPVASFKARGIGSVVKHALARAGIDSPRNGCHQFRHGLACQMLRQGASLSEIGELLRHRSPETTAIYAKVDLGSLTTLALPWPGGAQ